VIAVIITLDRTAAFDKALLAGWEIVGSYATRGPSPMGGPPESMTIVLRGHVTGCDGGIHDNRATGEPPPEEWFR
jgi:hypothetical protein